MRTNPYAQHAHGPGHGLQAQGQVGDRLAVGHGVGRDPAPGGSLQGLDGEGAAALAVDGLFYVCGPLAHSGQRTEKNQARKNTPEPSGPGAFFMRAGAQPQALSIQPCFETCLQQ